MARAFSSLQRRPSPRTAEDAQKEEWKDVIRWREQERGDVLLSMPVAVALQDSAEGFATA